jgi:hypothetical protein
VPNGDAGSVPNGDAGSVPNGAAGTKYVPRRVGVEKAAQGGFSTSGCG